MTADPMDRLTVPEIAELLGLKDPRAVHKLMGVEIPGMKRRAWTAYRRDVLAYIDRETAKQSERSARGRRRGRGRRAA